MSSQPVVMKHTMTMVWSLDQYGCWRTNIQTLWATFQHLGLISSVLKPISSFVIFHYICRLFTLMLHWIHTPLMAMMVLLEKMVSYANHWNLTLLLENIILHISWHLYICDTIHTLCSTKHYVTFHYIANWS